MRTAAIIAGIVAVAVGDNGIYTDVVWHEAVRQHCVKTVVYDGDVTNRSDICLRCPDCPPCPLVCGQTECRAEYPCPDVAACFQGPGVAVTGFCRLFDADGDGDADMADVCLLLRRDVAE